MKKILIVIISAIILLSIAYLFLNNTSTDNDYKNWSINKNEYPKNEYKLDELPVSHKSAYEVRKFFEDSDINHDGILKDDEINLFDYKIKHSQYTFNGPYGYN